MKTYTRDDTEVGGMHLVPCVQVMCNTAFAREGDWVPIYGPLHEDKEFINFPEEHWHIDWRFLNERNWRRVTELLHGAVLGSVHGRIISKKNTNGPVKQFKRRMLREMPHHPHEGSEHASDYLKECIVIGTHWLKPLEESMEGRRAQCGVCPHRGVKLGALRDKRGSLVCPAHGLTWSAKDGHLIRRTKTI